MQQHCYRFLQSRSFRGIKDDHTIHESKKHSSSCLSSDYKLCRRGDWTGKERMYVMRGLFFPFLFTSRRSSWWMQYSQSEKRDQLHWDLDVERNHSQGKRWLPPTQRIRPKQQQHQTCFLLRLLCEWKGRILISIHTSTRSDLLGREPPRNERPPFLVVWFWFGSLHYMLCAAGLDGSHISHFITFSSPQSIYLQSTQTQVCVSSVVGCTSKSNNNKTLACFHLHVPRSDLCIFRNYGW